MKDSKKMLKKKAMKKYNLISLPTIELLPKEAEKFITCAWDQSVMKNYARLVTMDKPEQRIRHIGFGQGKFLYPPDQFDESDYKKQWAHNRITLKTVKVRGCAPIYDDDIEEGLEGKAYKKRLMDLIAIQVANELEFAGYMADEHDYNSWCAKDIEGTFDGWRYIINHSQNGQQYYNNVCGAAHIKSACVGSSGAHFELAGKIAEQSQVEPFNLEIKYGMMLKNMPSKYKSMYGLKNLVFLNSDLVTQDYLMALETRGTALGDRAITDGDITYYHKVPIIDVPLMPTNLGPDNGTPDHYGIIAGGEYTDALLTFKNNLVIGIQKIMKIEPQRSAADECTYFFYTLKICYQIENVNAIVFLKCLEHKC